MPALPRRLTPAVALGLALLLLGAGGALIGASLRGGGATATLLGGDRPDLPINLSAHRATDLSANNSPSLAANPTDSANLVVSNRVDLPVFGCGLHRTLDGGATWIDTEIPIPAGEEPKCYAPDVAFGPDGTLYATFVTLKGTSNEPNAVWLTSSSDRGRTLSPPTAVTGRHAYQVRLAADPTRAGRLYVSWIQAAEVGNLSFTGTGSPVTIVRSDDGGGTWSAPVTVSPASRLRALAPAPAVGPGGQVYIAYLDLQGDSLDYNGGHEGRGGDAYPGRWSLVVARSTDRGASWTETTVDPGIVPIDRLIVFLPQFPSIAVDHASGRVYVAFQDARLGDPDVYLWSADGGATQFGQALRVNDTPEHDGTAQYLPLIAVAPGGRVDVVYYDRRDDRANVMNQVSLQSSVDSGRSFGPRLRLTDRAFDSRIGFGSERNLPDLGSRLTLLATDTRDLAVWTDTRAGNRTSGKQDLASAVVAFSTGGGGGGLVAGIGAGVALAGLLVIGLGLRRQREPGSVR